MTATSDLPVLPALVVGTVGHSRRLPLQHRFQHGVYQWLVDLDDLPAHRWPLRMVSRFEARDHFDGAGAGDLKSSVRTFLADHGVELGGAGRVVMLANARVLGHVFDPLSVFWCFGDDGGLACVVAEVHNTYGERHAYLLRLDEQGAAEADKRFYVSPFNDVSGRYRLQFELEPSRIRVAITLVRDGAAVFAADLEGVPSPARPLAVAWQALRMPLMPQRVSALIRMHGIRLWMRRLPLVPRPRTTATEGSAMTTINPPLCVRKPSLQRLCVRSVIARIIVGRALDAVPVRAVFPDGTVRGGGRPGAPTIQVVRPVALFERMAHNPKIGMGEAFMAGDWKAAPGTDLGELLTPFAARLTSLVPPGLRRLRGVVDRRIPHRHRNTLRGSRDNISAHYDLSNDLFALFLDPTMSYSSALFDGSPPFTGQDLEQAQQHKIDAVLDMADVREGSRVLEVGTGWGALAVAAARRGAHVTSVTLSREQLELALKRVALAGLAERVDIRLQDYREVRGSFDAIVSVEMIEAVGAEFWPTYFATLDRLLAPSGAIAIQAIHMDHDRMLATRHSFGWIQKYIFPGGLIPSVQAIEETLQEHTGLELSGRTDFGLHYAETLRRWRQSFDAQWGVIQAQGFDETFRRMWDFYLAYCEAGFQSGYLDVSQLRITRRTP